MGVGGMIKDGFATEDVFPIVGLMLSSSATNSRPSVSGVGINPQSVRQRFCQGHVEDAINVSKRFLFISIPNNATRDRSKLEVMEEVNGTMTASKL
jgi:hypothetical protein